MELSRRAKVLLRKARADEYAVAKLLADPACSDDVIGFHAQQAVEKIVKAVLSSASVPYPYTHDLVELIDLARDHGLAFPQELEDVRFLTTFAAELRCGDPETLGQPLDRQWALDCVRRTKAWAETLLGQHPAERSP